MAKQVLPVNFQDDVLNASMNGKRRYMLLQQDDGSYILNDVTNYDTEGSTFGAAQINATNQAVNQSVDKDDVLNTSEEVEANVDEKKVTGALVTKQLISEFADRLQGDVRIIPEGSGADTKYYAQVGADAASKKALGRPVITFRAKVYSGGWGQSRFIIPEGYSTLEIVSLSGNGNVYGYTGDETTDQNGTVLGLLSVTTYDISGYKEFGVRVNGNSGAQCVLY